MNDLQSESITPDDNNLIRRKSITSGRLIDDQENNSTPAIIDSSTNNIIQPPIRSMSASALIDHHDTNEQLSTLPIQQDENSTDDNDFDGIPSISKNIDNNQRPLSTNKQNNLENISRIKSTSSKRSVCCIFISKFNLK